MPKKLASLPQKHSGAVAAVFFSFAVMMILAGGSDALRGVFLPTFREHFKLTGGQSSWIIMTGYIGNLLFLLFGGRFVDRVSRRTAICSILLIFCAALAVYVCTDNYCWILFAMIFSMGASTLLSTTLNVFASAIFLASPGLSVNLFGFIHGIGTSSSQNLFGRIAEEFGNWRLINGAMLAVLVVMLLLIRFVIRVPEREKEWVALPETEKPSYRLVLKNPACPILGMIFGFYFVAEHGVMNWMTTYAADGFGLSADDGATLLSLFFLGITVGRLVLSPLVDRMGMFRCFTLFAVGATGLYVVGFFLDRPGLWLISGSGVLFSILYPTMVLAVSRYFPQHSISTATGVIISIGTLFDILFNLCFGSLADRVGIRTAVFILPLSMVIFCLCWFWLRKRVKPIQE